MKQGYEKIKESAANTACDQKETYHTPKLTVFGEAGRITRGNEDAQDCDAAQTSPHGEDPCGS